MSMGYASDNSGSRPYSEEEKKPPAESPAEDPKLLDQVLAATLQITGPDEPLPPEEMRSLVHIARQRKSEPLSVDTVMELVQSVLRLRFRRHVASNVQWQEMTRQIAETLFADPQAKSQLERLWKRLCEAAQ